MSRRRLSSSPTPFQVRVYPGFFDHRWLCSLICSAPCLGAVNCTTLPATSDGVVPYACTSTSDGASCSTSCAEGWSLASGSLTITCQQGQFSAASGTCVPNGARQWWAGLTIACARLPIVPPTDALCCAAVLPTACTAPPLPLAMGTWTCSGAASGGSCSARCDDGYTGQPVAGCFAGQWSHPSDQCKLASRERAAAAASAPCMQHRSCPL